QQAVERQQSDFVLNHKSLVRKRFMSDEAHTKAGATDGDSLADTAQAGDPEVFSSKGKIRLSRPLTSLDGRMLRDEVLGQSQDQAKCMLRDAVMVGARRYCDGDAAFAGRRQVDR